MVWRGFFCGGGVDVDAGGGVLEQPRGESRMRFAAAAAVAAAAVAAAAVVGVVTAFVICRFTAPTNAMLAASC